MQAIRPALPMRDHTVLGVCEGLGEDFGFNPLWLRLVFAGLLIWQPVYDIGAYLALGVIVAAARLLVPTRRHTAPAAAHAATAVAADAGEDREELAAAA
jgi:phage shock protein PspC (stress-responsive transcriptional regulator)